MRKFSTPRAAPSVSGIKAVTGLCALFVLSACGDEQTLKLSSISLGGKARTETVAILRPPADANGLIRLANQQAIIARDGDTPTIIAGRIGVDTNALAAFNAVKPDTALPEGVMLVLPPSGKKAAADNGHPPVGLHKVQKGETGWSVARKYNLPVTELAAWNGLPADMAVRTGQSLIIPPVKAAPAEAETISPPGAGSASPKPPSAALALPGEKPVPPATKVATATAPDLGSTRTAASLKGKFIIPANGPIMRAYKKGVNEGIDIRTPAGSAVKAASGGKVVAVTRDSAGAIIIAVQHQGDIVTLYAGLHEASVANGATVKAGSVLGKTGPKGTLHFEIRKGMTSVDPAEYL